MTTMDPLGAARTWDLSLYEMNRTPQEVCTDSTEIAVSQRSLHSELMCPICLDILKTTMTTKECLHRFCQECIITALRSGNKECPTCPKIYPSRDEYEHYQERVLAKLNKTCGQAFASSIEEGLKAQALSRKMTNRKRPTGERPGEGEEPSASSQTSQTANSPQNQNDGSVSDGSSRSSTPQPPLRKKGRAVAPDDTDESSTDNVVTVNEVELVAKPHPHEASQDSQIRYMKTTANATAEHLAAYFATRFDIDRSEKNQGLDSEKVSYTLYVSTGPQSYLALPGNITLEQINDKYWKQNRPLELFYVAKRVRDDDSK